MTPTPEQIAAMAERGWTHEGVRFRASSSQADRNGDYFIRLCVYLYDGHWFASYGWTGVGFDGMDPHPDPLLAADEAEAWLRGVLAGLRFGWLEVRNA